MQLPPATPFNRKKKVKKFSELSTGRSEIIGNALALHADSLRELEKGKNSKRYISKQLSRKKEGDVNFLAAMEVYSSWIFRLHVLDGSRIPKYSYIKNYGKNKLDTLVFSEKINGIKDLFDVHEESPSEFERAFREKLNNPSDNLKAFAQILVCSIVFAENDLKGEHLVFDGNDRFTRIDFDQCFWPDLDFSVDDFENLPLVSTFKPHNLFFNYGGSKVDEDLRGIGKKIEKLLGQEFKTDVYEAVLKILLMPDFLLEEIEGVLGACKGQISVQKIDLAKEKKAKLSACMMKSEGFREFLRLHGQEAKGRILSEIESFREHNSYFRKKWSKLAFHDQCVRSVSHAYSMLRIKIFIKTRLARNPIIGLGIFLLLAAAATAVLFFPPAGLSLAFSMGSLSLLAKCLIVVGAGVLGAGGIILAPFLQPNAKRGRVEMPDHADSSSKISGFDEAIEPVALPSAVVTTPTLLTQGTGDAPEAPVAATSAGEQTVVAMPSVMSALLANSLLAEGGGPAVPSFPSADNDRTEGTGNESAETAPFIPHVLSR